MAENDTYFADLPEDIVKEATKPPPPWDEGDYAAEITEAEAYQGEGKPYPCVVLNVAVRNAEGRTKRLRTWVLSKNPAPGAIAGAVNFLRAVGLTRHEYRNPKQLVGLVAPVRLVIKTGNDGIARNEIKYFVTKRS